MSDPGLIEALNDCIDRLAAGESIENCLRRHPQYERMLRPMLEAGSTVRRAQILPFETDAAEMRVRARVIDAMSEPVRRRVMPPLFNRVLPLVATLILVFTVMIGGSALLSRINQGDLTPTVEPNFTQTPSPSPTASVTTTATPSASATQTSTPTTTATATSSATATPSATVTIQATITPSATATPSPVITTTAAECVVTPPEGWSSYRIQAGDTLSGLAARGGVTLNDVMSVNCLTDGRLIVVGQTLYLPPLSPPLDPAPQPTASDNDNGGGNDNGGNENENDNEDSGGGNDN